MVLGNPAIWKLFLLLFKTYTQSVWYGIYSHTIWTTFVLSGNIILICQHCDCCPINYLSHSIWFYRIIFNFKHTIVILHSLVMVQCIWVFIVATWPTSFTVADWVTKPRSCPTWYEGPLWKFNYFVSFMYMPGSAHLS